MFYLEYGRNNIKIERRGKFTIWCILRKLIQFQFFFWTSQIRKKKKAIWPFEARFLNPIYFAFQKNTYFLIFCFLRIRVEGLSATHLHQKPMVKINFMKMKIMSLIIRIGSLFFIFLYFYSIYVQLLLEAVCSAFTGTCCYPLLFPICNWLLSKFSGIGLSPHFYKKHSFNFHLTCTCSE